MGFNKNTWTQDYTQAKGLGQLAAEDARRKGYTPKVKVKGSRKPSDKEE